MQNPSYHVVDDIMYNNGGTVSAAEAHGMLAGMLCLHQGMVAEDWLALAFGEARDELDDADAEAMDGFYAETLRRMQAVDFSFQLFLPDDDDSLTERVRALGEWCQGFLHGIGYTGPQQSWPDDCAEVLSDLVDISVLDENASGEEDETAFAEVSEFVRISVQLIHADMQPPLLKTYLH